MDLMTLIKYSQAYFRKMSGDAYSNVEWSVRTRNDETPECFYCDEEIHSPKYVLGLEKGKKFSVATFHTWCFESEMKHLAKIVSEHKEEFDVD